MSKIDKKKQKLITRIEHLESELAVSLAKKDSRTVEIDVPGRMRQIASLKAELAKL